MYSYPYAANNVHLHLHPISPASASALSLLRFGALPFAQQAAPLIRVAFYSCYRLRFTLLICKQVARYSLTVWLSIHVFLHLHFLLMVCFIQMVGWLLALGCQGWFSCLLFLSCLLRFHIWLKWFVSFDLMDRLLHTVYLLNHFISLFDKKSTRIEMIPYGFQFLNQEK